MLLNIFPKQKESFLQSKVLTLLPMQENRTALGKDKIMVVTISGRGDKDCAAIARYRGEDIHE